MLFQFISVSAYGSLTGIESLVLVLTAAVVVVEILLLAKFSKGRHKKIGGLVAEENEEIATFRVTIQKIRSLEAEKRSLMIEIEELKKTADAKATALESEVNALQNERKTRKGFLKDQNQLHTMNSKTSFMKLF